MSNSRDAEWRVLPSIEVADRAAENADDAYIQERALDWACNRIRCDMHTDDDGYAVVDQDDLLETLLTLILIGRQT